MEVRLYGHLAPLAGSRSLHLPVRDGETLGAALMRLVAAHPALAGQVLTPSGDALVPHVGVYLAGRNARDLEGLETCLGSADQLAIFPPMAGGAR